MFKIQMVGFKEQRPVKKHSDIFPIQHS